VKTSELTGAELDLWVAKAEGVKMAHGVPILPTDDGYEVYEPSRNWVHGGTVIERERIGLIPPVGAADKWGAFYLDAGGFHLEDGMHTSCSGPTPLIAAMRAYVAGKFGVDASGAE
jgi:hypothetical protein